MNRVDKFMMKFGRRLRLREYSHSSILHRQVITVGVFFGRIGLPPAIMGWAGLPPAMIGPSISE